MGDGQRGAFGPIAPHHVQARLKDSEADRGSVTILRRCIMACHVKGISAKQKTVMKIFSVQVT